MSDVCIGFGLNYETVYSSCSLQMRSISLQVHSCLWRSDAVGLDSWSYMSPLAAALAGGYYFLRARSKFVDAHSEVTLEEDYVSTFISAVSHVT